MNYHQVLAQRKLPNVVVAVSVQVLVRLVVVV
jgi:hypothetical protein